MATDSTALTAVEERPKDGARPRSSARVRADLERSEQRLRHHMAALRQEMTLSDLRVGGMPVLDHIRRSPMVAVGTALGLAAGLAVVTHLGRRRRRRKTQAEPLGVLVNQLMDRADARTGPRGDSEAILRRALRHRAPVIVVENAGRAAEAKSKGVILGALISSLRWASGYGLKFAVNEVARGFEARRDAPEPSPTQPPRQP